jgi:hypothetical protein
MTSVTDRPRVLQIREQDLLDAIQHAIEIDRVARHERAMAGEVRRYLRIAYETRARSHELDRVGFA